MSKAPSVHPVVGVVVPMYNASATIEETLASVCAQTYAELDIVVIDDGSRDGCGEIVERWAARDRRIRLVRQENGGVAAARNHGAVATDAPYLAFVDSDDLWAPDKVALQMAAIMNHGGEPALAYCLFMLIDKYGRAFTIPPEPALRPSIEGEVLRQLCRANFVGNGSSMLMPREIFDFVGGFDSSLRANKAQGCEDHLFLLHAAERYPFRVVTRYLVGYRVTPENMSGDAMQMLRSFEMVRDRFIQRQPAYAAEWTAHRNDVLMWLTYRSLAAGKLRAATRLIYLLRVQDSGALKTWPEMLRVYVASHLVPQWVKTVLHKLHPAGNRPRYEDLSW
jgi:glycosyltransferase involved in cell wall biosynthesis